MLSQSHVPIKAAQATTYSSVRSFNYLTVCKEHCYTVLDVLVASQRFVKLQTLLQLLHQEEGQLGCWSLRPSCAVYS
jgi:hypothetical protein